MQIREIIVILISFTFSSYIRTFHCLGYLPLDTGKHIKNAIYHYNGRGRNLDSSHCNAFPCSQNHNAYKIAV